MAHGSIGRLALPDQDELMEPVLSILDPGFVWHLGRIVDGCHRSKGCFSGRHARFWCLCCLRRTVLGIKDEEADDGGGEAR